MNARLLPLLLLATLLTACALLDPVPAAILHVAPHGTADGDGSARRPFATPEQARDHIRTLRANNTLPPSRITVLIHGGRYSVTRTFTLEARDSGQPGAPIVWAAAPRETPIFSGGLPLTGFTPVTDPSLRDRLPAAARPHAVQFDLAAAGLTNLPPLALAGYASGRGFHTHGTPELFCNGQAQPFAAWPERGFTEVHSVPTNEQAVTSHGRAGSASGRLGWADRDRLARWAGEPALWLHGYWFWDWADSYERVAAIDPAAGEIRLTPPLHRYGFRAGQPFRAINALCELDPPGEWHLDPAARRLVWYPPVPPASATVELSLLSAPLLRLQGVSDVVFRGLTWELGAGDLVHLADCRHIALEQCVARRAGGDGIVVQSGASNTLRRCTVQHLGRGGVVVNGGDRRTLAPAGHRIEDCVISDVSRIDRTYTPAVLVGGVGQVVARNEIHTVPSSALRVNGNEHLVAHNHIHHVVTESDDQGAVDMWGDPTFRGNVYRANWFHDVGSAWNGGADVKLGQAGIRLDDAISGTLIADNRFERCGAGSAGFGAVQIHGGKDNLIAGNVFIDCAAAVSFSAWGAPRWTNFVASRLDKGDLDAALYRARYPALTNLLADANRNEVRDNLLFGPTLFRRPPAALVQAGNRVESNAVPPAARPRAYGPR